MMNAYLDKRNVTIDLLRSITMLTMLMVNDFWSVSGIPHWMQHASASEDMLGFSDIVFPTFLFCVGLSIPYAISAMIRKGKSEGDVFRHILERSFALIVMGAFICNYESGIDPSSGYTGPIYSILITVSFILIWNNYKYSGWAVRSLKNVGIGILIFLLLTSRSPEGNTFYPYWWGILGLIGWAYLFCALVYAFVRKTSTHIIIWIVLFLVCLLCTNTAPNSVFNGEQILLLSSPNIINLTLSTLHIGNASSHLLVMSGVLFSAVYLRLSERWTLRKKTILTLCMTGLCAGIGLFTHQWFITSKIIGTLPWIFYTLSIDLILYSLLDIIQSLGKAHWFKAISPAGNATLTCYLVPYLIYPLITMTISWEWSKAFDGIFGITKCLLFAALCIAITWLLGKAKIKLKI